MKDPTLFHSYQNYDLKDYTPKGNHLTLSAIALNNMY